MSANNKKKDIIKKEISAFMRDEKGQISKHALIVMGAFVGSAAVAALFSAKNVRSAAVSISSSSSGTTATITAGHYG